MLPDLTQAGADDPADQGEHEDGQQRGLGQIDQPRARQGGQIADNEGDHHAGGIGAGMQDAEPGERTAESGQAGGQHPETHHQPAMPEALRQRRRGRQADHQRGAQPGWTEEADIEFHHPPDGTWLLARMPMHADAQWAGG